MKIVVVANPASSRGAGAAKRQRWMDALDRSLGKDGYTIVETSASGVAVRTGLLAAGSAGALARQAALEGADVVVAAGGDGTVGEVANGLAGTSACFGVLPTGTGNDFARTLGIGTDLDNAARVLAEGELLHIDLGKVSEGGFFVNVAGCGFDAVVAARINHGFRRVRGTLAYVLATLQTLATFRPAAIRLTADGKSYDEKVMLCAVANAQMYGGGMRIAPEASLTDGLLDLVLVGDVSKLEFIRAFPRVFKGTHLAHPKVKVLRAARVSISSDRPLPVLADGEEIGVTPVGFEIVPAALKVMAPANSL
ncbi:MAG: diacylglycerol kinase family protein [Fimbriimonadales bacterium]